MSVWVWCPDANTCVAVACTASLGVEWNFCVTPLALRFIRQRVMYDELYDDGRTTKHVLLVNVYTVCRRRRRVAAQVLLLLPLVTEECNQSNLSTRLQVRFTA